MRRLLRPSLVFLCLATAFVGLPAAFAPHAFYDDFPFATDWVDLLPPYNRHLVTDVGGLYLGFAALFAAAAWTLEATLVRAACAAWLVPAVLHLAFHASHLDNFDSGDAIGELLSLTLVIVPALLALFALRAPAQAGSGEP